MREALEQAKRDVVQLTVAVGGMNLATLFVAIGSLIGTILLGLGGALPGLSEALRSGLLWGGSVLLGTCIAVLLASYGHSRYWGTTTTWKTEQGSKR